MRLSALWIFPVKSMRGISVEEAEVGDRGFDGDRRFMLVDANGKFLSQRTQPKMALIDVAPEGDTLRMSAPGLSPVEVPRRPRGGAARRVQVWGDTMDAIAVDGGAAIGAWLGVDCELVYMPDESQRQVKEGGLASFADGYPFLVATTASLAELCRRGAGELEMIRFRPNLVVDGAEPFAEDEWQTLTIGGVSFRAVKPCARCTIPTVDPRTGEMGKEPLRTLAQFRRRDGEVWFGQNLVADGRGRLRVGDAVVVG
jgi:uncharacterized protein YcbX